jgi:hypothetical protein
MSPYDLDSDLRSPDASALVREYQTKLYDDFHIFFNQVKNLYLSTGINRSFV